MLNPISSSANLHYPATQKSTEFGFLSLPLEIREEIEKRLDFPSRQDLFEALTTATRNSEPIDSPILKLHLIKDRIQTEYQGVLIRSDERLKEFALSQLQRLLASGQLDQVVEKLALFELVCLVNDPAVFKFLQESVQQDARLKEKLLNWVERSKTEEVQPIAANALTLLVKADVALTGQDFRGIRVPRADLSCGVFDHTRFEAADLSGSNLQGAWLRQADLRHAKMGEVRFEELPTLKVGSPVIACCYSPDGHWLAVRDWSSIKLYDTKILKLKYTFESYDRENVSFVSFSVDGKWFAASVSDYDGEDVTVKLWNMESNFEQVPKTFEGYGGRKNSFSFSADGKWFALARFDRVMLWDLESDSEQVLETFEGHIDSVSFSADGRWLAVGAWSSVKLYDAKSLKFKYAFEEPKHRIGNVLLSSDGKWLIGSLRETLKLWSVESGPEQVSKILGGHNSCGAVNSVSFSADSKWLAAASGGSWGDTVTLWSMESGSAQATKIFEGHSDNVNSVSFSADSKWLASGSYDETVRFWRVESEPKTFKGHRRGMHSISLSSDGKWLASAGDDAAKLWRMKNSSAQVLKTFDGHTDQVESIPDRLGSVSLSADGKWLASGDTCDGKVNLRSIEEGSVQITKTFKGHSWGIWSISLSADGKWLASGNHDGTVNLWNLESNLEQEPKKFKVYGRLVSLSADGKWLASASPEGSVRLWNLESSLEQESKRFRAHPGGASSVSFSADGKWLASGGADCTVKLWSVEGNSAQEPKTFEGHTKEVTSISLSADGKWLASGSLDNTVRLWSLASGQCVATIKSFHEAVLSLAWRQAVKGQTQLVTAGEDKSIKGWRIEEKDDKCEVLLEWRSYYAQAALTATGARIEGAVGLSELNARLFEQLGAEAEL